MELCLSAVPSPREPTAVQRKRCTFCSPAGSVSWANWPLGNAVPNSLPPSLPPLADAPELRRKCTHTAGAAAAAGCQGQSGYNCGHLIWIMAAGQGQEGCWSCLEDYQRTFVTWRARTSATRVLTCWLFSQSVSAHVSTLPPFRFSSWAFWEVGRRWGEVGILKGFPTAPKAPQFYFMTLHPFV